MILRLYQIKTYQLCIELNHRVGEKVGFKIYLQFCGILKSYLLQLLTVHGKNDEAVDKLDAGPIDNKRVNG